jgi:hypothetical protein
MVETITIIVVEQIDVGIEDPEVETGAPDFPVPLGVFVIAEPGFPVPLGVCVLLREPDVANGSYSSADSLVITGLSRPPVA